MSVKRAYADVIAIGSFPDYFGSQQMTGTIVGFVVLLAGVTMIVRKS